MKLPHLTPARAKALAEIGITTEQAMAEWSAARLATAVNDINERTRTTPMATAAWLTAAFHEPEPVEPELDALDGWENVGDFSVWFQQRDAGDLVERRIRAVSHHDPTENHTEVWAGHEPEPVAPWMRGLVNGGESIDDSADATLDEPLDRRVELADDAPAASITTVRAAGGDRCVDLRPSDGSRPVVSDEWTLEVFVDADEHPPLTAELQLESLRGERTAIEATGDGPVLASEPVRCAPGYHQARLHIRHTSSGQVLESMTIPTILIRP